MPKKGQGIVKPGTMSVTCLIVDQFYAFGTKLQVFSVNLGLDCDVDFINLNTEILFAFLNFFLNLDLINLVICKRKNHNINSTSLHSG